LCVSLSCVRNGARRLLLRVSDLVEASHSDWRWCGAEVAGHEDFERLDVAVHVAVARLDVAVHVAADLLQVQRALATPDAPRRGGVEAAVLFPGAHLQEQLFAAGLGEQHGAAVLEGGLGVAEGLHGARLVLEVPHRVGGGVLLAYELGRHDAAVVVCRGRRCRRCPCPGLVEAGHVRGADAHLGRRHLGLGDADEQLRLILGLLARRAAGAVPAADVRSRAGGRSAGGR
jgi:hypothetical protein